MTRSMLAICALAALAIPAAASAAPVPRPPDGTYRYELRVAGVAAETGTVVVRGAPDALVVDDQTRIALQGVSAHAVARYDPVTLHPTAYAADVTSPAGSQHTDVGVAPGKLTIRVPGQTVDVPADPSAPLELIADNLTGTLVMIPAVVSSSHAKSFTLAVLRGGKAYVANVVTAGPAPSRPDGIAAGDVSLTVEIPSLSLREVYWYDPATFVVDDVSIPAQNAELRLTGRDAAVAVTAPAPLPTPLPTDPPNFRSEPIAFTSADGTVLAGTITIPPGRGRLPAVVLIHGSGALDRDETIGPNKIFLQLSNAISNAGFVAVRYDKRGVGESRAVHGATRDDLLADVRAAVAFARARSEVDPDRVFLLGHSEGAELAPTVAATDPRVAGLVLMGAPALPLSEISMRQLLASNPPERREAAKRAEAEALERIRRSTDASNAWYRSSMDVDPVVDVARGRAPILILQGESDVQVLASDLPRLIAAAKPNHDVTVRIFPGLDHLFEPIPAAETATPQRSLAWYLSTPERVDPEVLRTLLGWLQAHGARAASAVGVTEASRR